MGRHRTQVRGLEHGYPGGPRWSDPYHCEWSVVVGDRVRRLRQDRGWSLVELSRRVPKPEGGRYSPGYFSRLERGRASAALYVYLAIATELEVPPGSLLGPDDAQKQITDGELTLVRLVRRLGLSVDDAIARITGLK